MIVSDSNIIASFAAAGRLDLLWNVLKVQVIWIPPAVRDELQTAIDRGRSHLGPITDLLDTGQLRLIDLTDSDIIQAHALPPSLGRGEREAIAYCKRTSVGLLSNDRRAVNVCREQGVRCLDLAALLRLLWTTAIISKSEVRTIMSEIVRVEGTVFKNTEAIFKSPKH